MRKTISIHDLQIYYTGLKTELKNLQARNEKTKAHYLPRHISEKEEEIDSFLEKYKDVFEPDFGYSYEEVAKQVEFKGY